VANFDNTVIVALISSSGSVLVAIAALILNYRGFASIDARLNLLQSDMKDLNKSMTALEIDVALLNDKAGM
jgi:hypothetical protein